MTLVIWTLSTPDKIRPHLSLNARQKLKRIDLQFHLVPAPISPGHFCFKEMAAADHICNLQTLQINLSPGLRVKYNPHSSPTLLLDHIFPSQTFTVFLYV